MSILANRIKQRFANNSHNKLQVLPDNINKVSRKDIDLSKDVFQKKLMEIPKGILCYLKNNIVLLDNLLHKNAVCNDVSAQKP